MVQSQVICVLIINYQVCYKEQLGKGTSVSVTPEMERVKKNQENISSASPLSLVSFGCFTLINLSV